MSGLSKLTAWFVEDEEDLRGALESAIGDEFAKFIVARDGDDGLKKFKKIQTRYRYYRYYDACNGWFGYGKRD